jgi:recombinational DNA repair ATPase RecF
MEAPMLRLKTLRAKNCRGLINGPTLDFKNGGLLLCGSNGTGKSSFIDALEKVLTGKCSSLDTGDQGISWKEYGKHVDADGDPEIEVTLADGENITPLNLTTDPSKLRKQLQLFLVAACQQSFILRRRALIDFINAKPKERYQALEGFLNLHRFNAFEGLLKRASDDLAGKHAAKLNLKRTIEETLRKQLNMNAGDPVEEGTCLSAISKFLGEASLQPIHTVQQASETIAEIDAMLLSDTNMDKLKEVDILLAKLAEVPLSSNAIKTGRSFKDARQRYLNEQAKLKGQFYSEVLEKGIRWINDDTLDNCPLCNNQIDRPAVTKYVAGRLADQKELLELDKKQSDAHLNFKNSLLRHKDAFQAIERKWEPVLGRKFLAPHSEAVANLVAIEIAHRRQLDMSVVDADIEKLVQINLDDIAVSLKEELESHKSVLPDFQQYSRLHQAKSSLQLVLSQLDQVKTLAFEINRLAEAQPQIKKIVDLASKARKNAVQQLLNKIATIANGYFQKIHPGEEIGMPSLGVTERGSGSIQLESQFHGRKGHPRGHYSEGHVDSLGLCLFLAIRRLHHNQAPVLSLLVLDDVMHSVDGDHRRDTAEMIFEEFSDHQIIITTHDPLWFENLKEAAGKSGRQFEQRRIADWTIESGPVWGDHLSEYEWLVSAEAIKAKVADRVVKAGRLLEEVLQNLCHGLGAEIPFNIRGIYTIDPLWMAFYRKAKAHKTFFDKAKTEINQINELRKLRNWVGAHWNSWAGHLTDAESKAFTDAVLKLREHTYCLECRRFIERITQLDGVWSCKCEHLRYKK